MVRAAFFSQVVFELFVSQLRGISDVASPSFPRYFYLLERCDASPPATATCPSGQPWCALVPRLAMVKCFVLMIDLKCDDLVVQLFEVMFESIR